MCLLQIRFDDGTHKGVSGWMNSYNIQVVEDKDKKEFQNLLTSMLEHMELDGYECKIQYKPVVICKPQEPDEIIYNALIIGVKEKE